MSKPLVYLDTCIIGAVSGDQTGLTAHFWKLITSGGSAYTPVASPLVLKEADAGTPRYARARARLVRKLRMVPVPGNTAKLAQALRERMCWNDSMIVDSMHLVVATASGASFLVTWDGGILRSADLSSFWLTSHVGKPPMILSPELFMARKNPPLRFRRPIKAVREVRALRAKVMRLAGGDASKVMRILDSLAVV
jgi:predicted nucleic acid-binding protein